jgi:membrane protein YdbS with pleckstrin-like domain
MATTTNFTVGPNISLPGSVSVETVFPVLFSLIFLCWLLYTLVAIYHWLRHAGDSWIAVPTVALYLLVSGFLIFYATSGLH